MSPDPMIPTIYALSSAAGRAGVAVIRISGAHAGDVLDRLCHPQASRGEPLVGSSRGDAPRSICPSAKLRRPAPRRASLRHLHHPATGEIVDHALVLWLPGPGSFTGEDTVELHVHGGRAVVRAVLDAIAACPGARLAEPGEFTRRAFLDGRLDLTAAEGLADLIDAETEGQRRQALRQATASLTRLYDDWRDRLTMARGLVEAAIDFADEGDVGDQAFVHARDLAGRLATDFGRHLADGRRGEMLRDGLRVVLAGRPNAGKSSLMNALARRDVAIVSPEAGTTRDIVEVRLDLDGWPVIVSDTAGLRDAATAGAIEREGMRRTLARVEEADLVLWLMEPGCPVDDQPPEFAGIGPPVWTVPSKVDLAPALSMHGAAEPSDLQSRHPSRLGISVVTGEGLAALTDAIAGYAADRMGDLGDPVLTNARHRQHVTAAQEHLAAFLAGSMSDLELRAEDLRLAADAIGRLTGRIDPEDVLDAIFARFCIGK